MMWTVPEMTNELQSSPHGIKLPKNVAASTPLTPLGLNTPVKASPVKALKASPMKLKDPHQLSCSLSQTCNRVTQLSSKLDAAIAQLEPGARSSRVVAKVAKWQEVVAPVQHHGYVQLLDELKALRAENTRLSKVNAFVANAEHEEELKALRAENTRLTRVHVFVANAEHQDELKELRAENTRLAKVNAFVANAEHEDELKALRAENTRRTKLNTFMANAEHQDELKELRAENTRLTKVTAFMVHAEQSELNDEVTQLRAENSRLLAELGGEQQTSEAQILDLTKKLTQVTLKLKDSISKGTTMATASRNAISQLKIMEDELETLRRTERICRLKMTQSSVLIQKRRGELDETDQETLERLLR